MPLPLIPIAVGGAMMAGGTATAGGAMSVSGTGPRSAPYNYGGSASAADAYRQQYASGLQSGQQQALQGTEGLLQLGRWGQGEQLNRGYDITSALETETEARRLQARAAGGIMQAANAYQPGAQSRAAMELALQRNAQQSMALARSGSNEALGLRNAINAGAQASVDGLTQIGMVRAQEEQAAAQMRMQGAMASADAYSNLRGGDQSLAGFQAGRQQFGVQTAGNAYGGLANLGANREATYLGTQQSMEGMQMDARMAHEQARQQNRQQKRSMLYGLGAGLIGAGGQMMSMGFGGGGGGGAMNIAQAGQVAGASANSAAKSYGSAYVAGSGRP